MKSAIVLIGCGLLLCGCESTNLLTQSDPTPNPTLQNFNADWEECQRAAAANDATNDAPKEATNAATMGESPARRCMREKGYNDTRRN